MKKWFKSLFPLAWYAIVPFIIVIVGFILLALFGPEDEFMLKHY